MNASRTNSFAEAYAPDAPILIAGSSPSALARAEGTIEGTGLRVAGKVLVEMAPERIEALEADGVLKVEGDRGLAARFVTLFPLPPKAPRPG